MPPHVIKLRSENTNAFEHALALSRNRAKRQEHRKFFAEGVQTIRQALTYGWKIDAIYYSGDAELSSFARRVLDLSIARRHFELPSRLFDSLRWSRKQEKPSELIALVEMPPEDLSRIPIDEDSVIVVFDRPSDHGNLGTIIRTCEAFGVVGLIISGHAIDPYDPQTVRASMSSLFTLPVVRLASHREIRVWADNIRKQHPTFQLVGTSAHGSKDIGQQQFERPLALVIGNEKHGLSKNYAKVCDSMIRIPMQGSASSLNVASAAAVLLYEIQRRRTAAETQVSLQRSL